MDLGAYLQIESLDVIAKANGIEVPRLRGYRLMSTEKPCSDTSEQYRIFNKYVGRDDVLYIHARIGGANWAFYGGGELEKQPWFIEKVDDEYDNTYCDIYARISTKGE